MAKTIIEYLENNKKLLQNHYQKVKHLDSASPTVVLKNISFFTLYGYNSTCGKKLNYFYYIVILYIYLYIFVCVCMRRSSNDKSNISIILKKNILYNR